jgi:putative ABC transport system permease protein
MLQDVRFALRLLARHRVYTAVAVLTIALGIGLSATVFALVDGVMFRPLPYRDPSRLVTLYGAVRAENQFTMSVSVPDFTDWRAGSTAMQQIEATEGRAFARIRGVDETTVVYSTSVTSGFFDMLGVRAHIGRTLTAEDFAPSAPPAAVITYRLWRVAFGADPDVLGRRLTVGATEYAIAGVLPRSFVFPANRRSAPEVAIPFEPGTHANDRTARSLFLFGRLADGVTMAQAQAELDAIALRLKPLFVGRPNTHPGAFDGVTVRDLRIELTRSSRILVQLLFGAAATVFLIACVNLIALLVAENEERKSELAVRAALGASRWALARQLLIESSLLAALGAAVGWAMSAALFGLVVRRIPQWLQLLGEPRVDARAAMFAGILAVITVIVGGVVPALRAATGAPSVSLAAGSRQGTRRQVGRHVLVAVEVALATVLVAAGSIMMRSWIKLYAQDTGLDADRLIAIRAVPAGPADAAQRSLHNARLADAIRRVPGVTGIAFVDMPLLQRAVKGSNFVPPRLVPHPAGMDTDVTISPDYFAVTGMRILKGRPLTESDRGRAVVVTDGLAQRYWPGANPVGMTIQYGSGSREIVGVVSDAHDVSLDGAPVPTLFHVWDDANAPVATMLVRFSGASGATLGNVRQAVRSADDRAAIMMLSTVDDLLSVSVAERNFNTMLFGVFALAALTVALIGIYGLVSLLVARREREMGIRLALGATGRALQVFIVSGTLRWIAGGLAAGLAGALLCAQYLKPFVYQVQPNDPATLAGAAAGFLVVAAVASYIPARRAARVDPMIALRAE